MTDVRKLLILQWVVIAVLVLGGGAAIIMTTTKADQYKAEVQGQQGNMNSLREQIRQAKQHTPSPAPPLPEALNNRVSSPSPTTSPRR